MRLACCRALGAVVHYRCFEAKLWYPPHPGKPVALHSDKAGVFRVNAESPETGAPVSETGTA